MKILGIDPGYERLGVAIIEKQSSGKEELIFSCCIRTATHLTMPERLLGLGKELSAIIETYQPNEAALEELYFAKNTKTALLVAEAKGVIHYVLKQHSLSYVEYHPNTIKATITGNGKADKQSIAMMLPRLIRLQTTKKIDDELDAIAVALTHSAHMRVKLSTA